MFRKICSAVFTASVLVFLISFYACKSDSIIPISTIKDVTGKVVGIYGYPHKNIIIRIGNKTAVTSTDGFFFINDVQTPYDLYLKDSVKKTGYIYKGLTSDNIGIRLISSTPPPNSSAVVNVNYPPGLFQSDGKLIFTDEDYVNKYTPAGNNGGSINLYVAPGSSLTGKVIVLLFSKNNGRITSYDRFGMKDSITISAGETLNLNFTENDLSYNPVDKTVSYNLIPESGYTAGYRFLFLHFGTRQTLLYSSELAYEIINSDNFSLVIPEQLPQSFTPIFFAQAQNPSGVSCQEKFFLTGISGNLQMNSAPQLIYPPDNFHNADTNTIFSFDRYSTEPGIISVVFRETPGDTTYQILTSSENITLQGLSSFGFGSLSNKTFNWSCSKLGEYQSVDEYLSPALNVYKQFSSNTESRTFTTKP